MNLQRVEGTVLMGPALRESPEPVLFTGVEWGIGERRIRTAISCFEVTQGPQQGAALVLI